jgi:hypothetical protein
MKAAISVFNRFCEIIDNMDIYFLKFLFVILPLTLTFFFVIYSALYVYRNRSGYGVLIVSVAAFAGALRGFLRR